MFDAYMFGCILCVVHALSLPNQACYPCPAASSSPAAAAAAAGSRFQCFGCRWYLAPLLSSCMQLVLST